MKKVVSTLSTVLMLVVTGVTVFVVSQGNNRLDTQLHASTDTGPTSTVMTVAAPTDIANQDGNLLFFPSNETSWIGTGTTPAQSLLGIRFSGSPIPSDSHIISASLEITSPHQQTGIVKFAIYAEKNFQTLTFSPTAPPANRILTTTVEHYATTQFWQEQEVITLDVTSQIRELFSSAVPSSNVTLIIKAEDAVKNNKKFFSTTLSQAAPRLTIAYELPQRVHGE